MPADHKKHTSKKAAGALHADAKEFIPSFLKPSAAADAKPNGSRAATAGAPSDTAKAELPKSSVPAKPAWGAPSEAVKQAAPIKSQQPQPAHKQQQPTQAAQKPSQHKSHSGHRGGETHGGRKKGDKSAGKRPQDHASSTSAPDANANAGSWARAAGKQGHGAAGAGASAGGGARRHTQSRGGNGAEQGDRENDASWTRGKALPIELLAPGDGKTDSEKAVRRVGAGALLAMRLSFLAPPASWEETGKPPAECLWDTPTRIAEIEEASKTPRAGGDVVFPPKGSKRGGTGGKGGKHQNETAPPIEDCKPIEINEETRWKAKVFEGKDGSAEKAESKDEIIRKALLILNKLSLTKFDKLSDDFINCGIGRDIECLTEAVSLIVNKAQEEQHFSSMYAGLCLKLANTHFEGIDDGNKKGKRFKKILLDRCQTEFETETSVKIEAATKDVTGKEEYEYHSNLIKKHYLGHMRFIGELYKGDLISIKIMLCCLPQLLRGDEPSKENIENGKDSSGKLDEEKVECFAKLMTVIGSSLEKQSEAMKNVGKTDAADSLAECWKTVEELAGKQTAGGPQVSNRIKFMLQDLLEMKQNGWVTRRKEESAKTLAQIHNEVAREERARRSSSSNALMSMAKGDMRRGVSSGDVRALDKAQSKPQVDEDGFVSVAPSKSVHRSSSMTALQRSQSDGGWQKYNTRGSTVMGKPELGRKSSTSKSKLDNLPETKPSTTYLSPDKCGEKAKNILKEYFVGGDIDDAVLSIHELVGSGDEGSLKRGTKVVESAILYVLEMKHEEVDKFLSVYLRCAKENIIEGSSFVSGLSDPLEFLNDIVVDAPLATPILVRIVGELVKNDIIPFDFLLHAPEYFRTDHNAAMFGAQVLKSIGGDAMSSPKFIEVIEKLMTEEDKAAHRSARDIIDAV
ncbi:hypothetical protein HJC23_000932 [Cyclotella cryptica]|uniref:MI domain-containing protein n=1 Tax=Cyclotella cryptica TaxID=29204 RepID=A0ABD3QNB2_9STRA